MRFFIVLILTINLLFGQKPALNDRCLNPSDLLLNKWLLDQSNSNASYGPSIETPFGEPKTCIKTFENDLWYCFIPSKNGAYEINIVHKKCNTPAGLQALLIQTQSCINSDYQYLACSNKENLDTIKLFGLDLIKDVKYLIYVDGFDGTECSFDIAVLERKPEINAMDLKYLNYDCISENNISNFEEICDFKCEFINNCSKITLIPKSQNNGTFLIEFIQGNCGKIKSRIPQISFSNTNKFTFSDFSTPYENDKEYCYKIVYFDDYGKKHSSEPICVKSKLIEGFQVSFPKYFAQNQEFSYTFFIKNGGNYKIQILDNSNKILKDKSFNFKKNTQDLAYIDMKNYLPGNYIFKFQNEKGEFFEYELVKP